MRWWFYSFSNTNSSALSSFPGFNFLLLWSPSRRETCWKDGGSFPAPFLLYLLTSPPIFFLVSFTPLHFPQNLLLSSLYPSQFPYLSLLHPVFLLQFSLVLSHHIEICMEKAEMLLPLLKVRFHPIPLRHKTLPWSFKPPQMVPNIWVWTSCLSSSPLLSSRPSLAPLVYNLPFSFSC